MKNNEAIKTKNDYMNFINELKNNELTDNKKNNEIIETKNDYMNYRNYMNEVRNKKIGIVKKGIFAGHKDHKADSPYAEDFFIIGCTEKSGLKQYMPCRYSTFGGLYSGEAISEAKECIETYLKKKISTTKRYSFLKNH